MKSVLQVAVVILAIPAALYIGLSMMRLQRITKGIGAIAKRVGAPIQEGGRNVGGRIAHWGAGRGFMGRTVARVATGTVLPGGRRQLERIGESYRKGSTERMIARGMYRMKPSSRLSADVLEKVTPETIQRWVNDPANQGDVEALRSMVVDSRGAIKLSTAQRKALFSGVGQTPDSSLPSIEGAPTPVGPSPIAPGAPGGPPIGAPTGALPYSDRPVISGPPSGIGAAASRWWSDRPPILPRVRQESQRSGRLGMGYVAAHYLGGGSREWRGWIQRPFGRSGVNPTVSPPPNPPRGPGGPFAP